MTKDQIPADDILQVVNAADGAVVVAVHDRATRSLDIVCTVCGSPFTLLLSRGCTEDAKNGLRAALSENAVKHATIRHTPRTTTHGSQS